MNEKQKASALLQFMEDEWDGKAIINALNPLLKDEDLAALYDRLQGDGVIREPEEDDDPAQDVYSAYSEDMRKAVAYINEQLEPEDLFIISAQVNKNFKQHMNPAYGIDEGKIIDLLEEYGDDHDLGEGWWMEDCEMDDIVLLIDFEN